MEVLLRGWMTLVVLIAAWTDLRWRRIPNALTLSTILGVGIFRLGQGHGGTALAGAAVSAFVFLLPVFLVGPERAGAGDFKLGIALGLMVGFPRIVELLLVAFGLTALGGGVLWALRRLPPDRTLPMAPGLAAGALWALWGPG